MPRYSIKDLMLAITLIGVGIANFGYWITSEQARLPLNSMIVFFVLWHASGASIGVGIFSLFNRPWTGALAGCLAAFAGLVYMMWGLEGIDP